MKAYPGCDYGCETVYKCSCHAEAVIVSEDKYDTGGGHIEFAMWSHGQVVRAMPWKERLRWCWAILKTGVAWADCIILRPEVAKQLGEDLIERANRLSV